MCISYHIIPIIEKPQQNFVVLPSWSRGPLITSCNITAVDIGLGPTTKGNNCVGLHRCQIII